MGLFKVKIIERLTMDIEVEADSKQEAEKIVNAAWKNSEYILDSENFLDVEFAADEVLF